jgi:hypothetical protein
VIDDALMEIATKDADDLRNDRSRPENALRQAIETADVDRLGRRQSHLN